MMTNSSSKFFIGTLVVCFCLYLLVQIILLGALSLGKNTLPKDNTPRITASERIKPIGKLYIVGQPFIEQPSETVKPINLGKEIVTAICSRCHGVGLMHSPKLGKARDWAPRIEKGKTTLYSHAINGFKRMPARGGKKYLKDQEIEAAVDYMVSLILTE